jgi:transketolase
MAPAKRHFAAEFGVRCPTKAGTASLDAAEIAGARERLGWNYPPFIISEDVRGEWQAAGERGTDVRRAWETRLQSLPVERRAEFLRRQRREHPTGLDSAIAKLCDDFRKANAKITTRQAPASCSTA